MKLGGCWFQAGARAVGWEHRGLGAEGRFGASFVLCPGVGLLVLIPCYDLTVFTAHQFKINSWWPLWVSGGEIALESDLIFKTHWFLCVGFLFFFFLNLSMFMMLCLMYFVQIIQQIRGWFWLVEFLFSRSSSPHYLTSVLKQNHGRSLKGKH